MKHSPLAMLTPADRELLGRHMTRVDYPRGAVLLQEGAQRRALLIVRSGSVRVERLMQGRVILLREVGAGELLGDIGFVENAAASASVVAQDTCSADVVEGDVLQSLIAAEPGFAARFYHSLAISLARRTRATDVARMAEVSAAAQVNRFHMPRTGNISARQVPPALDQALEVFEREMLSAKRALRTGAPPVGEATRVAAACDAVVALLQTWTGEYELVDIGYSDLLSFRDPGTLAAGVGDCIFRETFPVFMQSTTMARCHAKPRGFPDDHATMAALHDQQAEGDGWLGPLIDRWFLDRPLPRSRRSTAAHVQAAIAAQAAAMPAGRSLYVASLASGCAAELFAFFAQHPQSAVSATCVDVDEQALLAAASRAEQARLAQRMTFVLGNALPADDNGGGDGSGLLQQPQQLVYALGLCDYLADDEVLALLNHAHAMLAPSGLLIVSNLASGQPDQPLMTHLLDWQTHHRTASELQALFARSAFEGQALAVSLDDVGVSWLAECRRAVSRGDSAGL